MTRKVRESIAQMFQILRESSSASSFGYRALSVLLSFSFFAIYSRVVFLLFMGAEGFYSYDLFADGSIGVNVFFFITEFTVILLSISTFGVLIPIFGKLIFGGSPGIAPYFVLGFTNFFMVIVVISAIIHGGGKTWLAWLLMWALSLLICLQISALLYASARNSLKSLAVVLVIVSGVTFPAHDQIASLLKIGLHYFGVGGDIPVAIEIERSGGSKTLTGKLVFMSPDNIYVALDGKGGISIINRSKAEVVNVAGKSK